jgi:purine-binding chemotaxis protein CheW
MAGAALICVAGELRCALPLAQVIETMRPLPIEPLSSVPGFVRGVSVIRGAPVPVVDLGLLLGGVSHATRFITLSLSSDGRVVALAVEGILGVRDVPALAELPPLLRDADTAAVAAIGTLDAALLVLLKVARVLSEEVWSALSRQGRGY